MNGYLLDTHVMLWWAGQPDRLSPQVSELLANAQSDLYVSVAAIWEVVIKRGVGKLEVPLTIADDLLKRGVRLLDIELDHVLAVADLPPLHSDPFDRVMVAQAKLENLILITHDQQMARYGVATIAT